MHSINIFVSIIMQHHIYSSRFICAPHAREQCQPLQGKRCVGISQSSAAPAGQKYQEADGKQSIAGPLPRASFWSEPIAICDSDSSLPISQSVSGGRCGPQSARHGVRYDTPPSKRQASMKVWIMYSYYWRTGATPIWNPFPLTEVTLLPPP